MQTPNILNEHNFKVVTRVRPLNSHQQEDLKNYEQCHNRKNKKRGLRLSPMAYTFYSKFYNVNISNIIQVIPPKIEVVDLQYKNTEKKMKNYTFHQVYLPKQSNLNIFNQSIKQHISMLTQGYNCTILAYGITGSGKTYTIFGRPHNIQQQGIAQLSFNYLFKQKTKIQKSENTSVIFKLSFIQIYNENIRDLLSNDITSNNKQFLNLQEDNKGGISCPELQELPVNKIEDIYQLIALGTGRRMCASTQANQFSSRSHAILQFTVNIVHQNQHNINAKLFIIDLAGSQKMQVLNNSKKIQEGANINRSLLALANCISILAQNGRKHVPYRDSKLTRMVKQSLGGNTKTIMVACISPNPFTIQETTTTLNYAYKAQNIHKTVTNNVQQQSNLDQQTYCVNCKASLQQINSKALQTQQLFQEIFEKVYKDIVENIQEGEQIKAMTTSMKQNQQVLWEDVRRVNEEQAKQLKNTMKKLMKTKHLLIKEVKNSIKSKSVQNFQIRKPLAELQIDKNTQQMMQRFSFAQDKPFDQTGNSTCKSAEKGYSNSTHRKRSRSKLQTIYI